MKNFKNHQLNILALAVGAGLIFGFMPSLLGMINFNSFGSWGIVSGAVLVLLELGYLSYVIQTKR